MGLTGLTIVIMILVATTAIIAEVRQNRREIIETATMVADLLDVINNKR